MGTSSAVFTTRHRASRILVDGQDLSGKTTLVRAIVVALGERGIPAMAHCGTLAGHHPLERWLWRAFLLVRQPDSGDGHRRGPARGLCLGPGPRPHLCASAVWHGAGAGRVRGPGRGGRHDRRPVPVSVPGAAVAPRLRHRGLLARTRPCMHDPASRHQRLLAVDMSVHSPEEMASAVIALLFLGQVLGPGQPLPELLTGQGS